MGLIKNEKVFQFFISETPTEEGRKQFFDYQSKGIKPDNPDLYYQALCNGKVKFDFLTSEYRKLWSNGEWWGFRMLWEDWKGNRWLLPFLCSWYPTLTGNKLPEWLDKEISREELRTQYGV